MKRLDKRRRIERKTNYSKRLKLLKSSSLRLVVRKTNKYLTGQIVESVNAKDKILFSVSSKELLEKGWPSNKAGGLKSLVAGYLTGFLLGNKAGKLKDDLILDSGLIPSSKGSRVYAFIRGVIDSGLNIKLDEKIAFSKEVIMKRNEEVFNKVLKEIDR